MHNIPHTEESKRKMRESRLGVRQPWRDRKPEIIDGVELWRCSTCKALYRKTDFYAEKRKSSVSKIKSQCKKCHSKTTVLTRDKDKARAAGRINEANRRARMAKARGHLSSSDMRLIRDRFGRECLKCGATKNLQWDHVIPLAKGGAHCVSNLQCLCRKCNEQKQARTMDFRSDAQKKWVYEFRRVP